MGNSNSYPAAHPDGKTMKAIIFTAYGKPDATLALADVPVPHAYDKSNQVLVRVHAAALNPVDKILVSGAMKMLKPVAGFPHVVGYDAAGVVAVADEAGAFQVGDEVLVRLFGPRDGGEGKTPYYRGAMAEYCVAQTAYCARKPANLSFAEAASVPLAGLTALQCLAGVAEGSRVFISGGAGGVGSLAIQIAKRVCHASLVVTTASPGEKTELCTSLGADAVVNYRSENFEEIYAGDKGQFDLCFDCTGESMKMAQIVKKGGKIITIHGTPTLESIRTIGGTGCIISMVIPKKAKRAEFKAAQAVGADWDHVFLRPSHEDIAALAGHLASGAVRPVLDGVWDAEPASWKGAFDRAFSGRAKGKCVVRFVKPDADAVEEGTRA